MIFLISLQTYEPNHEKTWLWDFDKVRPDKLGWQPQKMAYGLEFWNQEEVEALHYLK